MATRISRPDYAAMYGPTTGDRLRLGDTDLIIEVERDLIAERSGQNAPRYGEEVKFGGGKVIRDGMGQSQVTNRQGAADTVITNALIVDHWGIVKADIGLKDGRIVAIGKAGNPDTMPGVTPGMLVGSTTQQISGVNYIVTAGAIDRVGSVDPGETRRAIGELAGSILRPFAGRKTALSTNSLPAWSTADFP